MSQTENRDSVWWGSLLIAIYGVAFSATMIAMMTQYLSNPIIPEEVPLIGYTFAELQVVNPGLATYIWWVQNAFSMPGFTYPALFTLALAWKGVRTRQKWAWYTIAIIQTPFWILFYVGCRALHTTYLIHWAIFTPFLVLLVIGLTLSGREILAQ